VIRGIISKERDELAYSGVFVAWDRYSELDLMNGNVQSTCRQRRIPPTALQRK
jgi:hypothetical protein